MSPPKRQRQHQTPARCSPLRPQHAAAHDVQLEAQKVCTPMSILLLLCGLWLQDTLQHFIIRCPPTIY
jgi:hypothetical protein